MKFNNLLVLGGLALGGYLVYTKFIKPQSQTDTSGGATDLGGLLSNFQNYVDRTVKTSGDLLSSGFNQYLSNQGFVQPQVTTSSTQIVKPTTYYGSQTVSSPERTLLSPSFYNPSTGEVRTGITRLVGDLSAAPGALLSPSFYNPTLGTAWTGIQNWVTTAPGQFDVKPDWAPMQNWNQTWLSSAPAKQITTPTAPPFYGTTTSISYTPSGRPITTTTSTVAPSTDPLIKVVQDIGGGSHYAFDKSARNPSNIQTSRQQTIRAIVAQERARNPSYVPTRAESRYL